MMADDTMEDLDGLNFVKGNRVYIHGDFDDSISKHVIPDLHKLVDEQKAKKEGKIIFEICSNGGYVYILNELLSIIEQAKEEGIIVETRAVAEAHSCASILLMAGTPGYRYASPLSYVLVHHATQGYYSSTDTQAERQYNKLKHQNAIIKKLLKKYSTIPEAELNKMLSDDCYYINSDHLIKFGIVDHLTFKL